MNKLSKRFLTDATLYPEKRRETVFTTADGHAIDRVELVKRTDRQSYNLAWYLVTQNGQAVGAWKSIGQAKQQILRRQNPKAVGRKPQDRPTLEHILHELRERPELREFVAGIMALHLTRAELQTLATALKIAKEYGTQTATDWLKEHWPAPFEE